MADQYFIVKFADPGSDPSQWDLPELDPSAQALEPFVDELKTMPDQFKDWKPDPDTEMPLGEGAAFIDADPELKQWWSGLESKLDWVDEPFAAGAVSGQLKIQGNVIKGYLDSDIGKSLDQETQALLSSIAEASLTGDAKKFDAQIDEIVKNNPTLQAALKKENLLDNPDAKRRYVMKYAFGNIVSHHAKNQFTEDQYRATINNINDTLKGVAGEDVASSYIANLFQDPIGTLSAFLQDDRISSWNKFAVLLGIPMAVVGGFKLISSVLDPDDEFTIGEMLATLGGVAGVLYGFNAFPGVTGQKDKSGGGNP